MEQGSELVAIAYRLWGGDFAARRVSILLVGPSSHGGGQNQVFPFRREISGLCHPCCCNRRAPGALCFQRRSRHSSCPRGRRSGQTVTIIVEIPPGSLSTQRENLGSYFPAGRPTSPADLRSRRSAFPNIAGTAGWSDGLPPVEVSMVRMMIPFSVNCNRVFDNSRCLFRWLVGLGGKIWCKRFPAWIVAKLASRAASSDQSFPGRSKTTGSPFWGKLVRIKVAARDSSEGWVFASKPFQTLAFL